MLQTQKEFRCWGPHSGRIVCSEEGHQCCGINGELEYNIPLHASSNAEILSPSLILS